MKNVKDLAYADVGDIYVYRVNAKGEANVDNPIMILPSFLLGPLSASTIEVIADEETGAHYEILRLALIMRKDGTITPAALVQPWAGDGNVMTL